MRRQRLFVDTTDTLKNIHSMKHHRESPVSWPESGNKSIVGLSFDSVYLMVGVFFLEEYDCCGLLRVASDVLLEWRCAIA
jgi:hypothetical protein